MLNPHSLNGPELATLLAALGLIANAAVSFHMMKRSAHRLGQRRLQPVRARPKRDAKPI